MSEASTTISGNRSPARCPVLAAVATARLWCQAGRSASRPVDD